MTENDFRALLEGAVREAAEQPPITEEELARAIVADIDRAVKPHGGHATFVGVQAGRVYYSLGVPRVVYEIRLDDVP